MGSVALAVDIGATKIALALVDQSLNLMNPTEFLISGHSSESLWGEIEHRASTLISLYTGDVIGVGIGSAGPINVSTGTISPVNISVWRDFPIVEKMKSTFSLQNVSLRGDATAFTHAEHALGAGRGLTNLLGMVVSTGVGGGLVINNRIFLGESGNASFVGHQSINNDGELCTCGRRGCVEMYSSGPRMVLNAQALGWQGGTTFIDLAESARRGEYAAAEAINQGTRALAIGIVNTLAGLDIQHVVIGGGVSQAGEIFWQPLRKHLANESSFVGFLKDKIDIRPAKLVKESGLIGAALSVLQP